MLFRFLQRRACYAVGASSSPLYSAGDALSRRRAEMSPSPSFHAGLRGREKGCAGSSSPVHFSQHALRLMLRSHKNSSPATDYDDSRVCMQQLWSKFTRVYDGGCMHLCVGACPYHCGLLRRGACAASDLAGLGAARERMLLLMQERMT